MSLAPGTKLGPYEIREPIGAGGMGEVYKARDTRLERTVAIKVSAAQFSERFEREARAVAALNHPHICTLHDVGPDYLVMEYVEGKPLTGPLPIEDVLRYGIQIADALDAAHRKGIIHRDLKPANILLTKSAIKLLDFGLAKLTRPAAAADATVTRALTKENAILGTLQYMSPEQLQGKDADARSDIFAFGCVVYELITGRRAFDVIRCAEQRLGPGRGRPADSDGGPGSNSKTRAAAGDPELETVAGGARPRIAARWTIANFRRRSRLRRSFRGSGRSGARCCRRRPNPAAWESAAHYSGNRIREK
jgi:serine/threonine protein kinase